MVECTSTGVRKLEVVVEHEDGSYQKHFIGLSDNVTYVVEQKIIRMLANTNIH